MSSLSPELRRRLEAAVREARTIAETGARKALEALAVHEADPYRHMDEGQRNLRRRLRAQARQLGDGDSQVRRGGYEIAHLIEKLAYDQWHRVLFARFLLENDLLISPAHGISVSLNDCEELAPSLQLKDAWAVAAHFAAKELPDIFRSDDPAGAVEIPVEERNPLIRLVTDLPAQVFTASDSLGWCYQFWQAERKDEVNDSGNKIGADELPSVTQLFTEDYMVDFLLDNTLGAWHAAKVLSANPHLADRAGSEDELRQAVSLPGFQWKYIRFARGENGAWTPAAGAFEGWPKAARELKCLDPCMGSGHFIVAIFERIVALRMAEDGLDEQAAVAAAIRDNLFGLELEQRCTQIGAFNVALAAWRRVGHCALPAMNLACSGLAPNAREADWLALAGKSERLRAGMQQLYRLFRDAPVLGSLINPRTAGGNLLVAAFHELQPLLEKALAQESADDTAHELAVTARGVAKAAEILAGQFTLVATNVPYLGRTKQDDVLKEYCDRVHPRGKPDLATCFVERSLDYCSSGGAVGLVTPQNWLLLGAYRQLRARLLENVAWNFVVRLGTHAFETIGGEVVNVVLLGLSQREPRGSRFLGLDVSARQRPDDKRQAIAGDEVTMLVQGEQKNNPDGRVIIRPTGAKVQLLEEVAHVQEGLHTGDYPRFGRNFWELAALQNGWVAQEGAAQEENAAAGKEYALYWQSGRGELVEFVRERLQNDNVSSWIKGQEVWGRQGLSVGKMSGLRHTLYEGQPFTHGAFVIVPKVPSDLAALWCFAESGALAKAARQLDARVAIDRKALEHISCDLAHWRGVAAAKYPRGLPQLASSDPTQWLFNGHPKGSDHPLQVAVSRLLGYRWPRQTGSSFPECPALAADGLEELADSDGIVCLSATRGEAPAGERLRDLLARAWGKEWKASVLEDLLKRAEFSGRTLDEWLRNGFFEQHCALFHHRPFIWHIWDGHKAGFGALVNYHQLTHANLEKLTYAYLGDWIRRQQAAVEAGESGSDARLQAAKSLQTRLKLILDGEPPFDLFVRWKPISKQPVGWHPDMNDGVRINIRPLMAEDLPGSKRGAGVLRSKPNIKWEKDRGKEPQRDKKQFPWFWGWDEAKLDFTGIGNEPDGNRWNSCHYTNEFKRKAREAGKSR